MSLTIYLKAARLRTLPLAIAGTLTGNLLAYSETGRLDALTAVLSVLTSVFLQVLSNFANDYGDFKNGADRAERTDRVMASGQLSPASMKKAIQVLILLSLVSGLGMLIRGIDSLSPAFFFLFGLGLLGIAAAYFYTAGPKPYGYAGLGDLSVFLFFGFLAVVGTYYLQTRSLDSHIWWVGAAIGMLSVGVLNVNNLRDLENDAQRGKMTIAGRLGYKNALYYHNFLLHGSVALLSIYSIFNIRPGIILLSNYLIFSILFYLHYEELKRCRERADYNRQLKLLSLLILGMMLYFCLSEILFKPVWD